MDKKDIYEHLAKIYLDASSNKKNTHAKTLSPILKKIIPIIIFFVFGLGVAMFVKFQNSKPFNSQTSLVLLHETAKINFNFDPAKKENYSLDLNKLNVSRFKSLEFSAKKANYNDKISLRVEFTNAFKEKSEVYVKDVPHKWQNYKIDISKFKNVSDWTEMSNLVFSVEEWNSREKKGIVYLDNIRLTT